MSPVNPPRLNPMSSVMGQRIIDQPQAVLDWSNLERFITSNLPASSGAQAHNSVGQAIPNGGAVLSFDAVAFNVNGVWQAATPTRFTAPITGLYIVEAQVTLLTVVAALTQLIQVLVNGAFSGVQAGNFVGQALHLMAIMPLNAGAYVEFALTQLSGSAQNTTPGGTYGAVYLVRIT